MGPFILLAGGDSGLQVSTRVNDPKGGSFLLMNTDKEPEMMDEDIVVPARLGISVYWNTKNLIVIVQHNDDPDDRAVVVVHPCDARAVADAILNRAANPPEEQA